jgi:hypothetical protein
MDKLWLPVGHHYDLHISHKPIAATGTFSTGKWKLVWHITVSQWDAVNSMDSVLRGKGAEPHFLIGGRKELDHPIVIQYLPLNQFAKALQHPSGTAETNRAHAIQIEVCASPESVASWKRDGFYYKALGNLAALIHHRVEIPTKLARRFSDARRYSESGFLNANGHLGHMHVPHNDHFDPTNKFQGNSLIRCIKDAPNKL